MKSPKSKSQRIATLNEFNAAALAFAKTLQGGEVITLRGDLGAGKTTWVKALATYLGVKQAVTSPTFVIMNLYTCTHSSIKQLVHIDAYRLSNGNELIALGALEYFHQPNTVVCIEWPERVTQALTGKIITISISLQGTKRTITSHI